MKTTARNRDDARATGLPEKHSIAHDQFTAIIREYSRVCCRFIHHLNQGTGVEEAEEYSLHQCPSREKVRLAAEVEGYNLSTRQDRVNPAAPRGSQVRVYYLRWTLSCLHVVPDKYCDQSYSYEK